MTGAAGGEGATRRLSYILEIGGGRRAELSFEFDGATFDLLFARRDTAPEWTRLELHRCPRCPLSPERHARCLAALALADVVEAAVEVVSYEETAVTVVFPNRTVTAKVPAQEALRSLMGLLLPASGCPLTAWLKPMARFHLPFSDQDETLYRVASMYRLAQHIREGEGRGARPGLGELAELYAGLNEVNRHLVERLRAVARKDSSLNAVVTLDVFAQLLPFALDEPLDDLRPLFSAYLE